MKKSIGPQAIIQPNPVLIIGSYDQNGLPDIAKVQPFIYNSAGPDYYALGDFMGKAYSVGRRK